MDRFLVVIGCSPNKLNAIKKNDRRKLLDFIQSNQSKYAGGTISIVRTKMQGDKNFQKSGDNLGAEGLDRLDYPSNNIIAVPGYDVDCAHFRRDAQYDIIGISTGASVLCSALSMYSCGLNIRILKDYCVDRMGGKIHDAALQIMNAYMPGCVV